MHAYDIAPANGKCDGLLCSWMRALQEYARIIYVVGFSVFVFRNFIKVRALNRPQAAIMFIRVVKCGPKEDIVLRTLPISRILMPGESLASFGRLCGGRAPIKVRIWPEQLLAKPLIE